MRRKQSNICQQHSPCKWIDQCQPCRNQDCTVGRQRWWWQRQQWRTGPWRLQQPSPSMLWRYAGRQTAHADGTRAAGARSGVKAGIADASAGGGASAHAACAAVARERALGRGVGDQQRQNDEPRGEQQRIHRPARVGQRPGVASKNQKPGANEAPAALQPQKSTPTYHNITIAHNTTLFGAGAASGAPRNRENGNSRREVVEGIPTCSGPDNWHPHQPSHGSSHQHHIASRTASGGAGAAHAKKRV